MADSEPKDEYNPPEVWEPTESGGKFASINAPTSGARFDKDLPSGEHPFQLYSLATPNGVKVTVMLEELLEAGHDAEYDAFPIDIGEGEQFGSGFVELNPNSKIPAFLDRSTDPHTRVFESGAILLYLAEKFGAFLPTDHHARTQTLCWLFWQMGAAPYLGGGFGHFYAYAPSKMRYPIDRFTMETKRQLDLLDKQLTEHPFVAGSDYTIADMAIWSWYGQLVLGRLYEGSAKFLDVESYTRTVEWAQRIDERPAVQRGRMVNRTFGNENLQVPERHSMKDFEGKG